MEIDQEKCLLAQIIDITSRKRAQDALRASEAKLSAVIENLPVGVWIVDATCPQLLNPERTRFLMVRRSQVRVLTPLPNQKTTAQKPVVFL